MSENEKKSPSYQDVVKLASKPVLLLGNLASIVLTIAGILQAVSWTIAGAMILGILSITTLAPTRTRSGGRSTSKRSALHTTLDSRPFREKSSDKLPIRPHQPPSRTETVLSTRTESPKPSTSQARAEIQKSIAPKIAPPKIIPATVSPAKPNQTKLAFQGQDTIRPTPLQARPLPVGAMRQPPPKPDPNLKVIEQGDYKTVDIQLEKGSGVTCEVTASAPVNIYILDDENLTGLDLGEEFWSETGEEGVAKATLSFVAPANGKWFLVVENTDNKQVSATVKVKNNSPKPGPS